MAPRKAANAPPAAGPPAPGPKAAAEPAAPKAAAPDPKPKAAVPDAKAKAKAKAAAVPPDAQNPAVWPKLFGLGAPKAKPAVPKAAQPPPPDPEVDLLEFTTEHEALFGKGGAAVTAREKILLCIIHRNLKELWSGDNVEKVEFLSL